jgi:hypothetical protein
VDLSSNNNTDALAYFSNLGDRMNLIMLQTKDIAVPENMVGMYTKALRLARGLATLKEDGKDFNDNLSQIIMMKKITNLSIITDDFFQNDITTFMKSYVPSQS